MSVLPGVLRVDATYHLGDDGRLVADLPVRRVPVRDEGPLYRRLARLAQVSDAEVVAAASRYGPIGPIAPLSILDRPGFLLAASRQMRGILDRIPKLNRWIANGGHIPIKGREALAAHVLAVYAEADPQTSARLVEVLSEDGPRPSREERDRLIAACDVMEEVCLTALSKRIPELLDDLSHPERVTFVRPLPPADRHLRLAARVFPLLATKADELGPVSLLIPPDRLGGVGTEFAPYFPDGNVVPAESLDGWRTAARLLSAWTRIVRFRRHLTVRQRRDVRDALAAQLQRIDAWPLPTDQTLGAYARALWYLWPILGDSPTPRACAWPACVTLLPSDAHGNRRFCDAHVRENDRQRAARNRDRNLRLARQLAAIPGPSR